MTKDKYLRRPNNEDNERLLQMGATLGFPVFGTTGSNNGIIMLNASNVFNEVLSGHVSAVQYIVNGTQYDMGYYLANDIYSDFATFVKTISMPQGEKRKLFVQRQKSTRM
ncbi:hypothetical protein HKD37_18G050829 [Glycine soja]